ncbi:MAG: 30S ribosomal protein S9 [Candidatus Infernicultor aquiphilus]|uniref:Small ribosomal subunit protein uS9 n=1 Tax=Candidatus Infernicultor aquiphilus TaxID=1805029 RepID=A0A2M7KA93_9BACT|nr:30S ribosomal protein S9 [bacterium]PIX35056.1 MAG: 30S ribosomal protein S9 [Candidatus Atribacteria bacterium CG_4_8_14_3_um_filter_34_18]PIY32054.1 MAG: 30S ribosomal protein S9 [Candidatus Atribacteria bacterium CG_4_10_14_3_um_filter_34_13]PJB58029.1 MAG: 30S ribosomal protein S9 [Candidatus Atribacteria bacterium CG_4_9_14_3_um_filter_33_16]
MTQLKSYGTGRRKSSTARVWLVPGKGNIKINNKTLDKYFSGEVLWTAVEKPLELVNKKNELDVFVKVEGGGFTGQAGAIQHGIARALLKFDPALRSSLKKEGLLTRDSRMKERKKYGQKGARTRFQFSKR